MSYPWQPLERNDDSGSDSSAGAPDSIEAWSELFATTIAHLAAQLTMTQLRLRALATVAAERSAIDPNLVATRLAEIADAETGGYLRENLGAALSDAIDIDALTREIVTYLRKPSG